MVLKRQTLPLTSETETQNDSLRNPQSLNGKPLQTTYPARNNKRGR